MHNVHKLRKSDLTFFSFNRKVRAHKTKLLHPLRKQLCCKEQDKSTAKCTPNVLALTIYFARFYISTRCTFS